MWIHSIKEEWLRKGSGALSRVPDVSILLVLSFNPVISEAGLLSRPRLALGFLLLVFYIESKILLV